ncbi:aldose epimerase family protein [Photobacterium sp. DNB22_13_2]
MSSIKVQEWGKYQLYSLVNSQGTQIDISDLGGVIVNFFITDAQGEKKNIVLGYETPEEYLKGQCYFGCIVGPWANRIAHGRFTLNEVEYNLEQNEGTNHLHGASANLGAKSWLVNVVDDTTLELTTQVKAGEANYPCDIDFLVTYTLSEQNELGICYQAMPHAQTPINMTQHTYFNLSESENVLDHRIQIMSGHYLHVDALAIPLFIDSVDETPFDLREMQVIKDGINQDNEQLHSAGGYDHCWCFEPNGIEHVATVKEDKSGLQLDVLTDQIGLQFYSGNFISQELGRNNKLYGKHAGLCLETQCYPNQINMENKSDCIYSPSKPYCHNVVYKVQTSEV